MRVVVRPCRRCATPTLSAKAWRRFPWLREGKRRSRSGRGLCDLCYTWAHQRGRLDDYPRSTFAADDLLDEWAWLRSDGVRLVDAATRIGTTPDALDRALHRALARGDERGRHTGCAAARRARAA